MHRLLIILLLLGLATPSAAQPCGDTGVSLQVLGSGGPALVANRAGSGVLVWIDGQARALVDAGSGAALRFADSGARMADLDVLLLTRLHASHTADLPALVESARHEPRTRPLPIFGPPGNRYTPSTITFVRDLFDGRRGTYRHLGELISPLDKSSYKLEPHDVREPPAKLGTPRAASPIIANILQNERLRIQAFNSAQGTMPATTYRIEAGGKVMVIVAAGVTADASLRQLAAKADLLVVPDTTPESTGATAGITTIGQLAQDAGVRQLILTNRQSRPESREQELLASVQKTYKGTIQQADDLACFRP
jgi:ribonuclease BN (tRNA processing enzyme)